MTLTSEYSSAQSGKPAQPNSVEINQSNIIKNDTYENMQREISSMDEAAILEGLTEDVRDQNDLERDISHQANILLIEQEDERDKKRLDKAKTNLEKLQTQKRAQTRRLNSDINNHVLQNRCLRELERIKNEIVSFEKDITDIQARIDERHQYISGGDEENTLDSNQRMPDESEKDYLIRTGKITPFSQMPGKLLESQGDVYNDTTLVGDEVKSLDSGATKVEKRSHQNLRTPGFLASSHRKEVTLQPRKKRKIDNSLESADMQHESCSGDGSYSSAFSDHEDSDISDTSCFEELGDVSSRSCKNRSMASVKKDDKIDLTRIDDGNEKIYQSRLKTWVRKRKTARDQKIAETEGKREKTYLVNADDEEWFKPCPDKPDHLFDNGMKLPGDIYPALFDYQKTGVQWLGELYNQQVGGIIGDEMGLGKTIQVISFLASLHYSKKLTRPAIIIAPATVLQQWVNEFHKWWPPLRVSILHSSGSGMMSLCNENRMENSQEAYGVSEKKSTSKRVKKIVDQVVQKGHILITTYAGLQTYADVLLPVEWGYAVLDEGHKIRNPNTAITIHCKELRTPHRIIVSGTPMQNNLIELWSLFDFVFPMRLGTLVKFRQTFETPIKQGGYANSTNLQVLTATKCAEELKTAISPYLLQRLKVDVASDLPKKTEQVLFIKLTNSQRDSYEKFLASKEMSSILKGTRQSLYGIDVLKKICNHPDLLDPELKNNPNYQWADPNKSGKMRIVENLLRLWKGFNHKTLLFCQGIQMLEILEQFIKSLGGYNYLRMDGSTNIKDRQTLVDKFNSNSDLHVFLLTTKVGGLGVNLTGANRVLIFDPDWNPSTDVQARERAWRLGQKKEVTIYRLITAGTIEEKMYHRQIFKQFLTNKVLRDSKQRQTFQMKDLYDLFSLGSNEDITTETGQMFKGTEVQFKNGSENDREHKKDNTTQFKNIASKQDDSTAEVCKISGIAGFEEFSDFNGEDKPGSEEDRLMKGIFSGSGIQSALEHDQIINGKRKITADRGILEREAKKIAAEAAAELRKAVEAARNLKPGTVTWTGEFGSAGRPIYPRRGGFDGIQSSLKSQQNVLKNNCELSATTNRSLKPRGREFKSLIQSFIKKQGGSVASQTLVNHFNRICQTPQQTNEFKNVLGEVARLEAQQNSRIKGKWYLRDEFK